MNSTVKGILLPIDSTAARKIIIEIGPLDIVISIYETFTARTLIEIPANAPKNTSSKS